MRGMSIKAADDPLLHNAADADDGLNKNKGGRIRIAGGRLKIAGEELRQRLHQINASKEDHEIAQVLALMESSRDDSALAAAAAEVAIFSTRSAPPGFHGSRDGPDPQSGLQEEDEGRRVGSR